MKPRDRSSREIGLIWYGVHVAAYAGLFFSIVFNVWSVEKILTSDGALEWPHTLHVWLIQGGTFSISLIGFFLFFNRERLTAWLSAMTPARQSHVLLGALIAIEIMLGAAFMITKDHPGFSDWGYLFNAFNLNMDFNVPTLFAVAQIWLAGLLALLCAYRTKKAGDQGLSASLTWLLTSIVLIIMGFDELLSIHENAGRLFSGAGVKDVSFASQGYGYAWTLVALPLALILGGYFILRFRRIFAHAPYQLLTLIFAGIVFIVGAVFIENLQVYLQHHYGLTKGPTVWLLIEEMLEMVGMSIAVMVFYRHARELLTFSQTYG